MSKKIVLQKLQELNEKISKMTPQEVYDLLKPYLDQVEKDTPSGHLITEELTCFSGQEQFAWAC
jgi:hypothetical protein